MVIIMSLSAPCLAKEKKPIKTFPLEIEIDAPPDVVFPYLIYEDKIIKWRKDKSVETTFPNGVEPRVGKQVRVTMVNIPTQPWLLLEIAKLETNKEVVTRFVDGVLTGEFAYILTPLDGNRTRLVTELRVRSVGALVTVIWKLHGERVHRKKMWNFMKNMKQVIEKEWPGPSPAKPDTSG
jgi:hypothetical protein